MNVRLDELPRMILDEQVARLARAFPGKHGDSDGFIGELRRATRGWSPADLTSAVDTAIREERSYPRIATILKHRPEAPRPEYGKGGYGTCEQCGVMPYCAGYETASGQVFGRSRCDCPQRTPGWHTERARAYRETGDTMRKTG